MPLTSAAACVGGVTGTAGAGVPLAGTGPWEAAADGCCVPGEGAAGAGGAGGGGGAGMAEGEGTDAGPGATTGAAAGAGGPLAGAGP